jgi:ABC-type multidrug transport system fused ATPase/permease subunit
MQLLKLFFGILLVQMATVILMYLSPPDFTTIGMARLGIPLLFISLMASFWFLSISQYFYKDTEEKIKRDFAKEREKIKSDFAKEREKIKSDFASEREKLQINAERAKIKVIKEAEKNIAYEATKTHAKANFKVGLSVAGVIAVGGLFVFAQMVTVGLLALTTAGGAIGGYYYRGKRLENKRREELEIIDANIIEHKK